MSFVVFLETPLIELFTTQKFFNHKFHSNNMHSTSIAIPLMKYQVSFGYVFVQINTKRKSAADE